jgi:hypothetical protein
LTGIILLLRPVLGRDSKDAVSNPFRVVIPRYHDPWVGPPPATDQSTADKWNRSAVPHCLPILIALQTDRSDQKGGHESAHDLIKFTPADENGFPTSERSIENSPVLQHWVGSMSGFSPVGTAEPSQFPFQSSLRDSFPYELMVPSLKRWAFFERSYGCLVMKDRRRPDRRGETNRGLRDDTGRRATPGNRYRMESRPAVPDSLVLPAILRMVPGQCTKP